MNFGLSHLCFDKLKIVMQEEHRLFCGDDFFFSTFSFPLNAMTLNNMQTSEGVMSTVN